MTGRVQEVSAVPKMMSAITKMMISSGIPTEPNMAYTPWRFRCSLPG